MAVQRGEAEAAGSGMVCHHFSAGAALGALQPLGKDLCFRRGEKAMNKKLLGAKGIATSNKGYYY